jgi:predicted membrane protein
MKEKILPASLAGMVDYQTDAVVSKTIIEKTAGTVTVFALTGARFEASIRPLLMRWSRS